MTKKANVNETNTTEFVLTRETFKNLISEIGNFCSRYSVDKKDLQAFYKERVSQYVKAYGSLPREFWDEICKYCKEPIFEIRTRFYDVEKEHSEKWNAFLELAREREKMLIRSFTDFGTGDSIGIAFSKNSFEKSAYTFCKCLNTDEVSEEVKFQLFKAYFFAMVVSATEYGKKYYMIPKKSFDKMLESVPHFVERLKKETDDYYNQPHYSNARKEVANGELAWYAKQRGISKEELQQVAYIYVNNTWFPIADE